MESPSPASPHRSAIIGGRYFDLSIDEIFPDSFRTATESISGETEYRSSYEAQLMQQKIIWRSEIFPDMVFTDLQLQTFQKAYKHIKKYEPELRKAEAW